MTSKDVKLKRVYEPAEKADGCRVLVDRIWPRGLSKEKAQVDRWVREVAPSTELRQWFGHDQAKWAEFLERYRSELNGSEAVKELRAICREERVVTLVYAARDETHSNAVALKRILRL